MAQMMEKGRSSRPVPRITERRVQVFEVPPKERGESFADWVARVGNPVAGDFDVIYQMPFVHDGVRGVADFIERIVDNETGTVRYEPVDAKLARAAAKPGHVLQLCFYAEAIEALTGIAPVDLRIWLGSGRIESVRLTVQPTGDGCVGSSLQ
jgi:uncharacterized protein